VSSVFGSEQLQVSVTNPEIPVAPFEGIGLYGGVGPPFSLGGKTVLSVFEQLLMIKKTEMLKNIIARNLFIYKIPSEITGRKFPFSIT
jgi:hypothetical protein